LIAIDGLLSLRLAHATKGPALSGTVKPKLLKKQRPSLERALGGTVIGQKLMPGWALIWRFKTRKDSPMARRDGQKGTSNRGFASMDQERQREIASKGGQSVPPEKRSFSQDPQLAAEAGRKGGESVPPEGRSFSQNRSLAAEAGRKGGQARGAGRQMQEGGRQKQRPAGQQQKPDTPQKAETPHAAAHHDETEDIRHHDENADFHPQQGQDNIEGGDRPHNR
jgi:general stress protein YciG